MATVLREGREGEGRMENKKYASIQPLTPNIDQDRPGILDDEGEKREGSCWARHVSRFEGIKKVN